MKDSKTAVAKVMSKLMSLVRAFIVQEELMQQSVQKQLYLVQFFKRKAMVDFIPKVLEDAREALESHPYRNEYYYRHYLLLESEQSTFLNMVQDKSHPARRRLSDAGHIAKCHHRRTETPGI